MADNRGLILWTLGGAGVFLLYAAYKNASPQGLLVKHLGGPADVAPLSGGVPASPSAPASPAPGTQAPPAGPDAPSWNNDSLASSHIAKDGSGTYYALDNSGNPVAVIPGYYQTHPGLYIRPAVNA